MDIAIKYHIDKINWLEGLNFQITPEVAIKWKLLLKLASLNLNDRLYVCFQAWLSETFCQSSHDRQSCYISLWKLASGAQFSRYSRQRN